MKNVTISMEESVADWARVEAARRNMSLSRMLGEILAEKMRHEDSYERAYAQWQTSTLSWKTEPGTKYPSRSEVNDRSHGRDAAASR